MVQAIGTTATAEDRLSSACLGGKTALRRLAFIEPEDFTRLREPPEVIARIAAIKQEERPVCPACAFELTARVATFSYSKAFDYFQFRASWEAALRRLINAGTWLFIGYSLPEADFELRHLLKTAQMASQGDGAKAIHVVLKNDAQAANGDALVAGTALVHGLTLVTRNVEDFHWIQGLSLLNPFDTAPPQEPEQQG